MEKFKFDNQIKQEYLMSKPTKTAESVEFILKQADKFEEMAEKSIYNMSFSELKELVSIQFKNSSKRTLNTTISILRKYIYFCIQKNLVPHMENRLELFTSSVLDEFVSKQAINQKYHPKEQLKEYQDKLLNNQDKALIGCFYWGIRGRTTKEGSLEEVINLKIDPKSELTKNNMLELEKNNGEKRIITISKDFMNLLLLAQKQDEYITKNGQYSENSKRIHSSINKVKDYVFRIPGASKHEPFSVNFINGRMARIKDYVGNQYLNVNSLYFSGMITKALEIKEEKGEITNEDYRSICKEFDYNPDYFTFLKETCEQYM